MCWVASCPWRHRAEAKPADALKAAADGLDDLLKKSQ